MRLKKIITSIIKNREIVFYVIFGVGTTFINILTYCICTRWFDLNTTVSTIVAWIVAVVFAYFTNRIWVFESKASEYKDILKEFFSFIVCRVTTGIIDIVIMCFCVDIMKMNDVVIKIISNIIVIVLNYVASKLIIFRKV